MHETLVIVHLSSIDNYIDYYGLDAGVQLAEDLMGAITTASQTIIMDQGWDEISEAALLLRQEILNLQDFYPVVVFHHDELCDVSPWQDGMKRLAKVLRIMGMSRVRLGGLWASESGITGCVHEVYHQLQARNIPCSIDPSLIALEENDRRAVSISY